VKVKPQPGINGGTAADSVDAAGGSSAGGNGNGSSTLSRHYHTIPDPVQLGKTISRPVVSGDQLHGQITGEFDQNGLPLIAKGDCAACGQCISGQVNFICWIVVCATINWCRFNGTQ
jgi:hypothetical protein